MEENLCSYSSDKGLITRIYKQPKTLNTKEPIIQLINLKMNWTGNFWKKYKWLINTWRNVLKWIKMTLIITSQCSQNGYHLEYQILLRMSEKRTLMFCWWECKLVQQLWKSFWGSPKTKNGTICCTTLENICKGKLSQNSKALVLQYYSQ
jgi:hypothetical protein